MLSVRFHKTTFHYELRPKSAGCANFRQYVISVVPYNRKNINVDFTSNAQRSESWKHLRKWNTDINSEVTCDNIKVTNRSTNTFVPEHQKHWTAELCMQKRDLLTINPTKMCVYYDHVSNMAFSDTMTLIWQHVEWCFLMAPTLHIIFLKHICFPICAQTQWQNLIYLKTLMLCKCWKYIT
jgi:hypothetical protein